MLMRMHAALVQWQVEHGRHLFRDLGVLVLCVLSRRASVLIGGSSGASGSSRILCAPARPEEAPPAALSLRLMSSSVRWYLCCLK